MKTIFVPTSRPFVNRPAPQDLSNTPGIVQRRQARGRKVGNVAAPQQVLAPAGQPAIQFNRQQRANQMANQQLLDPQRNAAVAPNMNVPKPAEVLRNRAVQQNIGGQTQPRPDAKSFFGDSTPSLTLQAQREELHAMGPEGQAAVSVLEDQVRRFRDEYSTALARNSRPDMTEDDLAELAQSLPSYSDAIFDDASTYVQSNLPKSLKEARQEKAKQKLVFDQVQERARTNNKANIAFAIGEQRGEDYENGEELTPQELDWILTEYPGLQIMGPDGVTPLQRTEASIQEEAFKTQLDQRQRLFDQETKAKADQAKKDTQAAELEFDSIMSDLGVGPDDPRITTTVTEGGGRKRSFTDKTTEPKATPAQKARASEISDLNTQVRDLQKLERDLPNKLSKDESKNPKIVREGNKFKVVEGGDIDEDDAAAGDWSSARESLWGDMKAIIRPALKKLHTKAQSGLEEIEFNELLLEGNPQDPESVKDMYAAYQALQAADDSVPKQSLKQFKANMFNMRVSLFQLIEK